MLDMLSDKEEYCVMALSLPTLKWMWMEKYLSHTHAETTPSPQKRRVRGGEVGLKPAASAQDFCRSRENLVINYETQAPLFKRALACNYLTFCSEVN